ncbi:CoA transferase [Dactylosporangium salmoneum]|uniref:CoA transferase n=1 Tax=Dactylosporangium salmoneum TaxID=53361 RepID=A0ABP5SVS1_9ACTN
MAQREHRGVLSGLKVVEFAHVLSAPMAGTLLADLGADVIHVESPNAGDSSREIGPEKDGVFLWWKVMARNKRAITLDLRRPDGQQVARELVDWADVVITNMRVRTLERWGLDWPTLHARKPRLVYLSVTGDGLGTSDENAPGFGKVGEARSGVVSVTGFPDGPPVHTGFSHADTVTGLMGAFGIAAACFKLKDPGFEGELIDIALFEALFRLVDWQVIVHDQLGVVPRRAGNQLAVAPGLVVNTYPTRDGRWITVTSGTPKSVVNVIRLLGLDVEEYMGPRARPDAREDLDAHLRAWLAQRDTGEALEAMRQAEVVAEKVFDMADIIDSKLYKERDDIITIEDPELGPVRMAGVVPKLHVNPGHVWRTGPGHGQDNDEVFAEVLGMGQDRIATLRSNGVI